MSSLYRMIYRRKVLGGDDGQTMAEYGIVLSVICVATVAVFTALSEGVADAIDRAVGLIPG